MKIAVITGGSTAEREVSIRSAKNIADCIDFGKVITFTFPEEVGKFCKVSKLFDVAIPVIHGLGGEDGSVQGFLETLGVQYIFSGIYTHAIGIDKRTTKEVATLLGIKVSPETKKFPLFAKPNFGGSSVASKLCKNTKELSDLISKNKNTEFILEKPIIGREFTVGVIEYKNKTLALPVIEIIPKNGTFFDFKNKYDPKNLASEVCPAKIDSKLTKRLQNQALLMHKKLNARHISRSDFIVTNKNEIYFLEINTIPGMTGTSLVPKMLSAVKIKLRDLIFDFVKN